jgi:uncharacterized lipoprotein YmbA
MKQSACILFFISLSVLCGCSNLKPTTSSPRYFLLVAAQTPEKGIATNSTQTALESHRTSASAIALTSITIPDYLTKKSIAIRKSANEIEYLESAVWAERLDEGFLRVLTANLANQLPGYTVQHTRKNDVDLTIQITVRQFDLSMTGEGVLTAEWRTVSPANGKTIGAGQFSFSRKGPNPTKDPGGAVSTLSALIDDLSGALSKVIR